MSSRMIVMVSDMDDAKHGEINVLDNPQKAARLVESLLESGFDQERIRIFNGDEMGMQVTHRPVVALVGAGVPSNGKHAATEAVSNSEDTEAEELEETAPRSKAQFQEVAVSVEEKPTPYVKDGVKFSSLFRPA